VIVTKYKTMIWRIRRFYNRIKNVIRWLPTIWKDQDWDDFYIFEILRVKLKHQAKYIGDRDFFVGADRETEKMLLCIKLIERIQDDYYNTESHSYHKSNFIFDESEDGTDTYRLRIEEISEDFDSYFAKYPLEYKRVMNAEYCPFNRDTKSGIAFAMGHMIHKKSVRILFKTLEYNIERWWD
jgi:hypothetical protein